MFTSAQQVVNLLKLADDLGVAEELRRGLSSIWWWRRSVRRPARCCGPMDCRSTWSRRIRRWGTWCRKRRSRRAGLLKPQAAGGVDPRDATGGTRCGARAVARQRVSPRVPTRAGRLHAGVADAPGRALHGRVPRDPQADDVPRAVPQSAALQRGDVYGGRAAGRRRGDRVFGSAADPRADGHGVGVRRRTKGRRFTTRSASRATSIGWSSWKTPTSCTS